MQVGYDIVKSANCKSNLLLGLDKKFLTLVLKFIFIISNSSGYRQTKCYFPTFIKPCPLHHKTHLTHTENKKLYY